MVTPPRALAARLPRVSFMVLGLAACSGDPEISSGPGGGGTGAFAPTGGGAAGGATAGGGGAAGEGGAGGLCEPGGFPPEPQPYPVTIAGQTAWVHDEGFSSGYFHTYDELTLPGPDDRPRKVHVFLPRDYNSTCDRYPVVYMNDGETTFWPGGPGNKSWSVAQGLEALYAEGAIPPVLIVAIHAIDRSYEYSHTPWAPDVQCCGIQKYSDYLSDAVKPFIDESYRTLAAPESTAIVGSSRGGLCAFLVPNLRPDSFRKAGCLSPSFWIGLEPVWGGDFSGGSLASSKLLDMTKGTLSDPPSRPRLWIDWGLVFTGGFHNEVIEKNAAKYGQEMVNLLQAEYGYADGQTLSWMEDPIGEHDEVSWARRFPLAMKALFGTD